MEQHNIPGNERLDEQALTKAQVTPAPASDNSVTSITSLALSTSTLTLPAKQTRSTLPEVETQDPLLSPLHSQSPLSSSSSSHPEPSQTRPASAQPKRKRGRPRKVEGIPNPPKKHVRVSNREVFIGKRVIRDRNGNLAGTGHDYAMPPSSLSSLLLQVVQQPPPAPQAPQAPPPPPPQSQSQPQPQPQSQTLPPKSTIRLPQDKSLISAKIANGKRIKYNPTHLEQDRYPSDLKVGDKISQTNYMLITAVDDNGFSYQSMRGQDQQIWNITTWAPYRCVHSSQYSVERRVDARELRHILTHDVKSDVCTITMTPTPQLNRLELARALLHRPLDCKTELEAIAAADELSTRPQQTVQCRILSRVRPALWEESKIRTQQAKNRSEMQGKRDDGSSDDIFVLDVLRQAGANEERICRLDEIESLIWRDVRHVVHI